MATIGPVKLALKVEGDTATVDVTYDIKFSATDVKKQQSYKEECRIIGDDTNPSDAAAGAGDDDTLEFISPLFNKPVQPGETNTLSRRHQKSFRALDLNEDHGLHPEPRRDPGARHPDAGAPVEAQADPPGEPDGEAQDGLIGPGRLHLYSYVH